MEPILNFTDAAIRYIKDMLAQSQGRAFRISVKKTGCSGYSYAPSIVNEETEGDVHLQVRNNLDIYLDPQCTSLLKGLTVDFIEEKKEGTLKQKKLVFINPNEKSRCGCGESFHV